MVPRKELQADEKPQCRSYLAERFLLHWPKSSSTPLPKLQMEARDSTLGPELPHWLSLLFNPDLLMRQVSWAPQPEVWPARSCAFKSSAAPLSHGQGC